VASPAGPKSIAVDAFGEPWIVTLTGTAYARAGLVWALQIGDFDRIATGDGGAIWGLNAYGQATQLTKLVERVYLRNPA
jgi:hypothetical protein